jgi:hypothetical protein
MKKVLKFSGIAFVLFLMTISTFAQVTKTATATATIVATINMTKEVDLNFGNLAVTNVSGTVVLAPMSGTPTRTPSGGVTLPNVAGTVTAAKFVVTGQPNYTFAITVPGVSEPTTITNTTGTGGETMIVDNFLSNPTPTGQLDAGGSATFYVGATVNVGAYQVPGVYVSQVPFNVTVNYN